MFVPWPLPNLWSCENLGIFCDMVCCTSIGVPQRVFYGGRTTKNGGRGILIKSKSILWHVCIEGSGGRWIVTMPTHVYCMPRLVTYLTKMFDRLLWRSLMGWGANVKMRPREPRRRKKWTWIIVWETPTSVVISELLFGIVLIVEMQWSRNSVNLKNRGLSQLVFFGSFFLGK